MFCKYCGTQTSDGSDVCQNCKGKYVNEVEQPVKPVVEVSSSESSNNQQNTNSSSNSTANNTQTNTNTNTNSNATNNNTGITPPPKSKLAAGLLGIFLGGLGVHNFYLGYTGKAVAQLLISLLTCGCLAFVSSIWGLIEGILILTGEINVDANGRPLGE